MTGEVVLPNPVAEVIATSDVPGLMKQIRPQWQAKGLIERVRRLLTVDPSSACQRLLNAAVADLREKVKIAGLDIAKEAAAAHKLPPVERPEDVENYSTSRLLDLAYRMGLLTRAEWRRMTRAYDIRRDLEHEDSEYEAGVEDCVYIFKTCIEAVLAKDPVQLIRVAEVKEIIEAAGPAVADLALVEDYERAPDTRQLEILKFLVSTALDTGRPELVRQNAFAVLRALNGPTRDAVRVDLASHVLERLNRDPLTEALVRVANAIGILPYLRKAPRVEFFRGFNARLAEVSYHWTSHSSHGALLRALQEYGGLRAVPEEELPTTLKWLVLCYVGEPGGYGAGINRRVFYSNSAAPLIESLIADGADVVRERLALLGDEREVKRALQASTYVERR
ncbi:MAG: hypothetical protein AB1778_06635, partial [Candidatus Bipolaricaulota bacterium]